MENSSNLLSQIISVFGKDISLYEILGLPSSSVTQEEISSAYRKKSLRYHPDRSGGSTSHFHALSACHYILSNHRLRERYNEIGLNGMIEENELIVEESEREREGGKEGEDDYEFWYNYYRTLFPKITEEDIVLYQQKYQNSMEEKNDIYEAYEKYQGDMKKIMETIMFAEDNDEERIVGIIDEGIEQNRIESTSKYEKRKKRTAAVSQNQKKEKM